MNSAKMAASVCGQSPRAGYALAQQCATAQAQLEPKLDQPVVDKIGQLEGQVNYFREALDRLERRIQPILADEIPSESAEKAEPFHCQLHLHLSNRVSEFSGLLGRLERIIGRVRI